MSPRGPRLYICGSFELFLHRAQGTVNLVLVQKTMCSPVLGLFQLFPFLCFRCPLFFLVFVCFPLTFVSPNRFRLQSLPAPCPLPSSRVLLSRTPFGNLAGGPCLVSTIISNFSCISAYAKVNGSLDRTSSYISCHSRLWILRVVVWWFL